MTLVNRKDFDINNSNYFTMPPILIACETNRVGVLQALLAKNADVNAKGHEGQTSLHIAAKKGYTAIAKMLLLAKVEVNTVDS